MATAMRLNWEKPPSELAGRVADYRERLLNAIRSLMDVYGGRLTEWAQSNAPWTDRTGNARQGLSHELEEDGSRFTLILFHSMSYGIWLEIRWSGRWSIIMKAINYHYPLLMSALAGLVR